MKAGSTQEPATVATTSSERWAEPVRRRHSALTSLAMIQGTCSKLTTNTVAEKRGTRAHGARHELRLPLRRAIGST